MIVSLRKNNEFQRVYKKGTYKAGRYLVMYVLPNKEGINRIGIAAGKKFGNSVQRNRMKRIIREVYRVSREHMAEGYDIIFMARASVRKAKSPNNKLKAVSVPAYHEIEKEMKRLSSALGMLI
ncbi:MAG TPA: ribonuclease P protein component [Clostridiales bacterium]|jgi:ribonuclease P protein component|uniref:Ribonuclease P protein component n=1 Tax=Candidatus Egerieisoma faecipullorum TaxID=2840963 RepID=A0A9D1LB97_9CLOT|nr:ribonuclease P protein component [Clostridiales bacterium]HIU30008.1 ribonuclease P protein component [Candidatus Egerieisoma faecipullorum]